MFEVNRQPSARELRRFATLVPLVLLGLGALVYFRTHRAVLAAILIGAGALIVLISLASASLARKLFVAWMLVGAAAGRIMSVVILTLIYCLLLPPFALIRLRDPLRYRLQSGESYWEPCRPPDPTLERARRLF